MSIQLPSTIDVSALPSSAPPHSAVLSLLSPPLTSYTFPPFPPTHLALSLNDTPTACLLATLPHSLSYIHAHCSSPLLIHCLNGHSRSSATLLAYLLYLNASSSTFPLPTPRHRVQTTLAAIRARFPCAHPSPSFLRQLAAFAERDIHPPHKYHFPSKDIAYRTKAGALETAEICHALSLAWPTISPSLPDALPWHSLLLPDPSRESAGMRCRKCRAPLVHRDGEIKGGAADGGGVRRVWPTEWMGACVMAEQGRMKCWACGGKVGGYRRDAASRGWRGGEFWITTSAVDLAV